MLREMDFIENDWDRLLLGHRKREIGDIKPERK
jgi:hypothetical protein